VDRFRGPGILQGAALSARPSVALVCTLQTYTGSILIAANPFMRVPGLYTQEMKEQYRGAQIGELSPHVFAIADNAYRYLKAPTQVSLQPPAMCLHLQQEAGIGTPCRPSCSYRAPEGWTLFEYSA